jgi:hypothetical protein
VGACGGLVSFGVMMGSLGFPVSCYLFPVGVGKKSG